MSFACKGLVDVADLWDSGPRGTNGTLPADKYTKIGMAFTKSGSGSFACKGLVDVSDVWDSGPKGESEVMTPVCLGFGLCGVLWVATYAWKVARSTVMDS